MAEIKKWSKCATCGHNASWHFFNKGKCVELNCTCKQFTMEQEVD